jgi:hypothetical protein
VRDCDVTLFIEEGEPARRAFPYAHGQSDSRSECAARHGRKFNLDGEAPAADYFQQVYRKQFARFLADHLSDVSFALAYYLTSSPRFTYPGMEALLWERFDGQ